MSMIIPNMGAMEQVVKISFTILNFQQCQCQMYYECILGHDTWYKNPQKLSACAFNSSIRPPMISFNVDDIVNWIPNDLNEFQWIP